MKWRIVKRAYSDENIYYIVEHKFLFRWVTASDVWQTGWFTDLQTAKDWAKTHFRTVVSNKVVFP